MRVIAEQIDVVEADIAQLYENWFIETCQDWVVPYIGDLIGYQNVRSYGTNAIADEKGNNILIPGVAELKYESGCRDVVLLRLYKDFGIMQNHFHTWNQQRLIPRREVANTIRYRRRKRTLALLELLVDKVAGRHKL
ncbi:MAG: hypothetical protein V7L20_23095 [Nostoc sp.]|uniref:hypothetical protein n=1 Tax=Nostoc sp. TaxID=1180 RepID=UPI002FFB7CCA